MVGYEAEGDNKIITWRVMRMEAKSQDRSVLILFYLGRYTNELSQDEKSVGQ
jgi:hypothetical protein